MHATSNIKIWWMKTYIHIWVKQCRNILIINVMKNTMFLTWKWYLKLPKELQVVQEQMHKLQNWLLPQQSLQKCKHTYRISWWNFHKIVADISKLVIYSYKSTKSYNGKFSLWNLYVCTKTFESKVKGNIVKVLELKS